MTTKREIDNLAKAKVTSITIVRDDRGEVESIRVESKAKYWDLKAELNKQATDMVISVAETSKPKPVKAPKAPKKVVEPALGDPEQVLQNLNPLIHF